MSEPAHMPLLRRLNLVMAGEDHDVGMSALVDQLSLIIVDAWPDRREAPHIATLVGVGLVERVEQISQAKNHQGKVAQ